MVINLNDRKFLKALEKEAWERANTEGTNQVWASVYRRLAEVVNELDAYNDRSNA